MWYEDMFDCLGEDMDRVFAAQFAHTHAEVDFAEQVLRLSPPARVLDLCCGTGRHSIELARRGHAVTGLDRSEPLLSVGRRRARAAGVRVRWVRRDMRHPPSDPPFDAVLSLFTSWGYFTEEEENQKVLDGAAAALSPGGRLLLDVLNRDRVAARMEPRARSLGAGVLVDEARRFEPARGLLHVRWRVRFDDGRRYTWRAAARIYSLAEITSRLEAAGLRREAVFGGFDGSPLQSDSGRCIVVAVRDAGAARSGVGARDATVVRSHLAPHI